MEKSVSIPDNSQKGVEEARLDHNHVNIFTPLTKTLLPPHISAHLQSLPAPAVADVATGTGVWLEDLAAELPASARLDGYDLDTSKFRPAEVLPRNVRLGLGNALERFPEDLHGQYDVVHVRLLVPLLDAAQWEAVSANLKELLKPGGWLLWDELFFPSRTCLPMSKSFYEWISAEVKHAISLGDGARYIMPIPMLDHFRGLGFDNCDRKTFSTFEGDASYRKAAGTSLATAAFNSMVAIVGRGGFGYVKTREDAQRLRDGMLNDLDNAHEMGFEMWWTWGQNPAISRGVAL